MPSDMSVCNSRYLCNSRAAGGAHVEVEFFFSFLNFGVPQLSFVLDTPVGWESMDWSNSGPELIFRRMKVPMPPIKNVK